MSAWPPKVWGRHHLSDCFGQVSRPVGQCAQDFLLLCEERGDAVAKAGTAGHPGRQRRTGVRIVLLIRVDIERQAPGIDRKGILVSKVIETSVGKCVCQFGKPLLIIVIELVGIFLRDPSMRSISASNFSRNSHNMPRNSRLAARNRTAFTCPYRHSSRFSSVRWIGGQCLGDLVRQGKQPVIERG